MRSADALAVTDPLFIVVQCITLAAGVVAGVWLLRRRHAEHGRVRVGDVFRAGVWTVGAAALLTLAGAFVGVVEAFGAIRFGFLTGVVAVPAVGVTLLGAWALRRTQLTPAAVALSLLGLAGAPLGAWMAWVEPYDLRLETAEIVLPPERDGVEPLRVGVLADLQCDSVGDYERRAVAELLAQQPDVIVVPGDLFQGTREEWERWREPLLDLLAGVHAPGGVYFVPGDTDRREHLVALRERTDWTILLNDIVDVRVRDRHLRIAGVANRASTSLARELESMRGDGDIRIIVSHAPDVVLGLGDAPRADLIVAGHTHGGQIVVPGFGPPMTLSHVPRAMAAGGLHVHEERRIYVSRGVGLERRQAPRVRLLCPPEISVLTLRSADQISR